MWLRQFPTQLTCFQPAATSQDKPSDSSPDPKGSLFGFFCETNHNDPRVILNQHSLDDSNIYITIISPHYESPCFQHSSPAGITISSNDSNIFLPALAPWLPWLRIRWGQRPRVSKGYSAPVSAPARSWRPCRTCDTSWRCLAETPQKPDERNSTASWHIKAIKRFWKGIKSDQIGSSTNTVVLYASNDVLMSTCRNSTKLAATPSVV